MQIKLQAWKDSQEGGCGYSGREEDTEEGAMGERVSCVTFFICITRPILPWCCELEQSQQKFGLSAEPSGAGVQEFDHEMFLLLYFTVPCCWGSAWSSFSEPQQGRSLQPCPESRGAVLGSALGLFQALQVHCRDFAL